MAYPITNLDDVNPQDEQNLLVFLEQVASGCASGKFSEWTQLRSAVKYVLSRLEKMMCGHVRANFVQISEHVKGCAACYEVKYQIEKDAQIAESHMVECRHRVSASCDCNRQRGKREAIAQAIREGK